MDRPVVTSPLPWIRADPAEPDQPDQPTRADLPAELAGRNAPSDVAMADWGDLLSAVKARLRSIAAYAELELTQAAAIEPTRRFRSDVLECVLALDQLHDTLKHELDRRPALAQDLMEVQATLADARRQLAGTQAEERQARHIALNDSPTSLPRA